MQWLKGGLQSPSDTGPSAVPTAPSDCVTAGKSLEFSEPLFLPLKNGTIRFPPP